MTTRRTFLTTTTLGAAGLTVAFNRIARAAGMADELHLALRSRDDSPLATPEAVR